jgi:hypothetical protein
MSNLANNVTIDARSASDIPCFECYGFPAGHPASDLNFDFKGFRLAPGEVTVEVPGAIAHTAAVGWWDALLLKSEVTPSGGRDRSRNGFSHPSGAAQGQCLGKLPARHYWPCHSPERFLVRADPQGKTLSQPGRSLQQA